jgi:DNA ligase-1
METVIEILESLETTASSNARRDILVRHRSNTLLRDVFAASQDHYTVYYVNKFKMPAHDPRPEGDDKVVESFLSFIKDELSTRQITGNAAKAAVVAWFSSMSPLQQKWCLRILLKNLRCGVQETTVNKVWPGTIKGFNVALATTLPSTHDPERGIVLSERPNYPVRVEPKLDGLRCIAIKKSGCVTMFTRNGTELDTLPTIKAALEAAPYDNCVLDGEAMGADWNESASVVMSRKFAKDDSNIVYHVFDAVHLNTWLSQEVDESVPYFIRLGNVADILAGVKGPIKQVEGITVHNEQELLTFYGFTMQKGYEGIMLKDISAPYYFKRSDAIQKLKPVTTFEGVVVGWYEGQRGSKREGQFGGFNVVLPNGIVTRVGGGFTDALRAEIQLMGPDNFCGKIVEVEGQPDPLTKDGLTIDGKIRFPVFSRYRDPSDVDPKVLAAGEAYMAQQLKETA